MSRNYIINIYNIYIYNKNNQTLIKRSFICHFYEYIVMILFKYVCTLDHWIQV